MIDQIFAILMALFGVMAVLVLVVGHLYYVTRKNTNLTSRIFEEHQRNGWHQQNQVAHATTLSKDNTNSIVNLSNRVNKLEQANAINDSVAKAKNEFFSGFLDK